ncbi:MAG: pilus assembly protein N-terminal domain-containing protein [Alphaproteobacteria bacterium]|nr:hypothetical protein [Rhodospirillaceae bacterium]MDP6024126.1 pilus assembly protein N-terminal domain-containing protein [Alphaproteobacteria bacterium]MDP6253338.1 pilus assembly protein N-terminal domain-containing protein [Alphaproteobacteria bacterium]MDP7055255.1 pilus assembly protein N-terminal domain-containing protein [Alphaproteobacteria bacterium]|tara:strand:- start:843 stop:1484 length:642 start_codon:yes stop_codon:yes gene_type:complete
MNSRKPCLGQSLSLLSLFRLGRLRLGLSYFLIVLAALGFIVGKADAAETTTSETRKDGAANVIALEVGKAQLIRLSATPNVIMLGNPAVADVVVEDDGLLFLLGQEPGETNMIILDQAGKVIISAAIVVGPMKKRRVTVDRGQETFTLSCNPRCVPVATPQGTGATTATATATATDAESASGSESTEQTATDDQTADIASALSGLLSDQQEQE